MLQVVLIDGYVDEPTCLGVPPYISPYPRYLAGVIWDFDKKAQIVYLTIDQLRNDRSLFTILAKSDMIIVIAGMAVPGRYLGGYPVSPRELIYFFEKINKPIKVLTGPAAHFGFGLSGGKKAIDVSYVHEVFDIIITGDGEIVVQQLLKNKLESSSICPSLCRKDQTQISIPSIKGARIVQQHPNFPEYLIAEIETYRGCPRTFVGGCSFCSEPSKGLPLFRSIKEIISEIEALYTSGVRHFRLGSQPCIFSYMANGVGELEFPKPNSKALKLLFQGIRAVAPALQTLHIDNANPGVLARYPQECKIIAKTIVHYHTPGDVAAFGMESADPIVIKDNNLKATPEEVLKAIKLLNEVGSGQGSNGMPELLPGLNFLVGLKGETKKTFDLNFSFLKQVYDSGLLLRRINLRQVIPIPDTPLFKIGLKNVKKHKHEFRQFKIKVREHIEKPMLSRIVPKHTKLLNIYTEIHKGNVTFGRQLGSYPLLIGIAGRYPLHKYYNVKIIDYGYRSVTALPYPLDINTVSLETLSAIPGIGKKRAARILRQRPYSSIQEILHSLDDPKIGEELVPLLQ